MVDGSLRMWSKGLGNEFLTDDSRLRDCGTSPSEPGRMSFGQSKREKRSWTNSTIVALSVLQSAAKQSHFLVDRGQTSNRATTVSVTNLSPSFSSTMFLDRLASDEFV